jgi:toxin ParE1/3/4
MPQVKWSERALQDFEEALGYIANDNSRNAELFRQRIFHTLENLETFSLGSPAPAGTLKLYIPNTSYFVIFRRDEAKDILLLAFLHGARDWTRIEWEKLS